MDDLVEIFGLEYGVKFYISRSDLYVNKICDLAWNNDVKWEYNWDLSSPMVIIYLYKPIDYGMEDSDW
jgi:hypothetical protein